MSEFACDLCEDEGIVVAGMSLFALPARPYLVACPKCKPPRADPRHDFPLEGGPK